jgi:hypothetical protein
LQNARGLLVSKHFCGLWFKNFIFLGGLIVKKTFTVSMIALLLVFAFGDAFADYVNIEHIGFGAKDTLNIWGGGHVDRTVYGGVIMFEVTGASAGSPWTVGGEYGAFCMDLPQGISSGVETYNVINVEDGPNPTNFLGSAMGTAKANYLRELWGRYYDDSWVGSGSFTYTQKQAAEAFGAAVWEIVYEDLPANPLSWNVSVDGTIGSHGFQATNLDSVLANQWLHSLNGQGPMADLAAWSNNCFQDMLVEVPEPATVGLMGLGAGMMLFGRKKKAGVA